ncbi:MAG: hypothetical protein NT077_01525 [Candidatus Taylorbacteria bacterium]|nr:hypothetical protein [Candidatus Taylorbacteria bacterium]
MKRVIVSTAGHIHDHRAKLSLVILSACVLVAVFYAVNLYTLVSHTIAIKQIESRAASLSGSLSALDAEYLKLTSTITPDILAEHGLVAGEVSLYITRPAPTASAGNLASLGNEL